MPGNGNRGNAVRKGECGRDVFSFRQSDAKPAVKGIPGTRGIHSPYIRWRNQPFALRSPVINARFSQGNYHVVYPQAD